MKVVFFGTPQFAIPSLEILLRDSYFQVLAVVTQPDKRRGRGSEMTPSPVKKLALDHQIPVWQPERCRKDALVQDYLKATQADVFVVVAYGQILPASLLAIPSLGCINLHGSILPQYRGAAPIQWSLYHGDRETGITTMLMDEGMDTGAMLLKSYLSVSLFDNAQDIADQLARIGADLLQETLKTLSILQPISQDDNLATYAPLIKKTDYLLDWTKTAIQLHNQVRGFYPDCYTSFRDNPLKVVSTLPLQLEYIQSSADELGLIAQNWGDLAELKGRIGEVVWLLKNIGPVIQTGSGLLLLKQVQVAGKKLQSGWDFVNGMRIFVGEQLS